MSHDSELFSLIWMLTCTALVLLMQARFTCLETGLQEMGTSGLTEISAALGEICQNHIPSHIPKQIEISRMTIARILPACPVEVQH
jgi:hypothetical protein